MKYSKLLVICSFLILFIGLVIFLFINNPKQETTIRVTAVIKNFTPKVEFWEVMRTGMRTAAAEFGVELEIYGPMSEEDVEGQIIITRNIIENNPPMALILAAADHTALAPLVDQASAAKIPVITVDSGVDSSIPVTFVATNNIEAGKKIAEEMIRLIEPQKELAIINHVQGTSTAIEREKGVRLVLERDGRYPIIGTWFTGNSSDNAYEVTMRLLDEYPYLGGILATTELNTIGAARAIQEKGHKGEIIIVGFDNSLQEIKFIEDGTVAATVIQKPFNMGYLAVRAARDVIENRSQPSFIDTGSVLITRDNLYEPENQKLLFPFVELFQRFYGTEEEFNYIE